MKKFILINGNGGAGKKTTAQLLYQQLPDSAWLHMRWVLALKAWEPTSRFNELGIRNSAAVINNYFAEGVGQVIHSGNISDKTQLDHLLGLLHYECKVFYFWLVANPDVRLERLVARARDDGDKIEFVEHVLSKYSCSPPNMRIANGAYLEIETSKKKPEDVVHTILTVLTATIPTLNAIEQL